MNLKICATCTHFRIKKTDLPQSTKFTDYPEEFWESRKWCFLSLMDSDYWKSQSPPTEFPLIIFIASKYFHMSSECPYILEHAVS